MKKLGCYVLAALLATLTSFAYAKCTANEVYNFEKKWKDVSDSNDPKRVADLYSKHVVFIGAFSHEPLMTHADLLQYFTKLFKKNSRVKVIFNEKKQSHVTLLDGGAVSTGVYVLEKSKNKVISKTPIRFTMIYRDSSNGCELVVHHASIANRSS